MRTGVPGLGASGLGALALLEELNEVADVVFVCVHSEVVDLGFGKHCGKFALVAVGGVSEGGSYATAARINDAELAGFAVAQAN